MNEKEFENLSAWLDDEVDSETEKLVESAMQSDSQTAMACADLRKLNNLLDRWQSPEPKEALKDIICLSAKNSRRDNIFFRARYLVPIAAAAVFVIAVLAITTPWAGEQGTAAGTFDWQAMTQSQQLQARQEARAYLKLSPEMQSQILAASAKELSLTLKDNKQLGAVMATFSKDQIAQLKKLPFAERMRIIETRKQELISKKIIE